MILRKKRLLVSIILCLQCFNTGANYKFDNDADNISDHIIAYQDILTELAQLNEICIVKQQGSEEHVERKKKKNFTAILFMSADNDLQSFAVRNIRQMAALGSNDYLNIVVHLDIRIGSKKVTRRFYVEKDNVIEFTGPDMMDSGDPETLISHVKFAVENFPAEHYMLILWNHGTGPLDPVSSRIVKPVDLFTFNPVTYKLELDRTLEYFNFIQESDEPHLGVCWDDSTHHYLTNQKLQYAFNTIKRDILGGQKFDIIAFDACMMAAIEIDHLLKDYAHISIASQEVELGTGWYYQKVFTPFQHGPIDPYDLAKHIVKVYEQSYKPITNDYTLSAVNLDLIDKLVINVDIIARLLNDCLNQQKNNSAKKAIAAARHRKACVHFNEPSYIDWYDFCNNLQKHVKYIALKDSQNTLRMQNILQAALEESKTLVNAIVLENVTGKNLNRAKGILIYFPERRIHSSYPKIPFAETEWLTFLTNYLLMA